MMMSPPQAGMMMSPPGMLAPQAPYPYWQAGAVAPAGMMTAPQPGHYSPGPQWVPQPEGAALALFPPSPAPGTGTPLASGAFNHPTTGMGHPGAAPDAYHHPAMGHPGAVAPLGLGAYHPAVTQQPTAPGVPSPAPVGLETPLPVTHDGQAPPTPGATPATASDASGPDAGSASGPQPHAGSSPSGYPASPGGGGPGVSGPVPVPAVPAGDRQVASEPQAAQAAVAAPFPDSGASV